MKNTTLHLLALFLGLLLAGCGQSNPSTNTARPKKLRVAFVANNVNDYWSLLRLGCDTAVSQLDQVDFSYRTPTTRTAEAQQEVINQLLAGGLDAIAISPIDAEKQTEFLNSIPTNILLVCADSDAPKTRRVCYVGTDNVAAGKQAADLLKAALPDGGKVVVLVGYPKAQNIEERLEGLKAALAGSNLQVVDTLADESKAPLAQKNAEDALAKYPDLAGFIGCNSYTGPAMLQAVRSAGKAGRVKIVCFDHDSDTLAGISSGDVYGTVTQKPWKIGYQAVSAMAAYLRGDKTALASGRLLVPTRVVTKDDLASFQIEIKNLKSTTEN